MWAMENETNETIEETAPSQIEGEKPTEKNKAPWIRWVVFGFLFVILATLAAGWLGWGKGKFIYNNRQETAQADDLNTQFQLGMIELASEQYQRAILRFEYVLNIDPNYPGAQKALEDALFGTLLTATFTPVPTPTLTPTPDLRSVEEKFANAQASIENQQWDEALDTLDSLRKEDPTYQAVAVDGMYYLAYRHRGVNKIQNEGNLESGIYDLDLAENYGPLDTLAKNLREWATWYLTGASFWEINWAQAVAYFEQVVLVVPNLRDASGMTAGERYRIATWKYGMELYDAHEWCLAAQMFAISLSYGPNPELEPIATQTAYNCNPPTNTPPPLPVDPTPTPTP